MKLGRAVRPALPPTLALVVACSPSEGTEAPSQPPLRVATQRVDERTAYTVERRFAGTVRSRRRSRLAFERGGLVHRVFVDDGDSVRRGQVVARLDTAQLEAARRRVQAARRRASAGASISELTAGRLSELAAERLTPQQASDEARFDLEAARARVEELEARLSEIDVDLAKSRLLAPFDGVVSARRVDEGAVVSAGAPVVELLERVGKEAVVGVPVAVAADLSAGRTVPLEVSGRTVTATVTSQVRDVTARTRTVSLVLALPPRAEAPDGAVVDLVHTHRVEQRGFWIPSTALTQGLRGLSTVYAVRGDGDDLRVVREEVEILHADTGRAYVRGTLSSEDRIIPTGLHRVVPGQRVKP